MHKLLIILGSVLFLSACGHMPDTEVKSVEPDSYNLSDAS